MLRVLILTILGLGLSACGILSRHPGSGYTDDFGFIKTTIQDHYENKFRRAEEQARTELGVSINKTLDEVEKAVVQARLKVSRLEKNLENPRERKQYYQLKPFFNSDQERIEFLSLPSTEARDRYVQYKNIDTTESQFAPEINKLVEDGDIGLGMSKKAVRESWGEPDFVDVAGDQLYGNERWKYIKYISTDEGYTQENRLIFFEAGRVAGWESAR